MKKLKIISIIILITILAYFTWNFIEIRRLELATKDINPLAKKTIESLYSNDLEFLDYISGTDEAKSILNERMKTLKRSQYNSIEIIQTNIENINVYSVVILSSNEIQYHEHILKFRKINNRWKVIDLKFTSM